MRKHHPALRPLRIFRRHVFRNEDNVRAPPNQFVHRRRRRWRHQRQQGRPIRRSHRQPSLAALQPCIERQMKPKLLEIKLQAAILVAHIHVDAMHPQMRIALQCAAAGGTAHARNYKSEWPTTCTAFSVLKSQAMWSFSRHHPSCANFRGHCYIQINIGKE